MSVSTSSKDPSPKSFIEDIEVYVTPNNIWDYFYDNLMDMETHTVIIARNKKTGCDICLTSLDGVPDIEVYMGDEQICSQSCISPDDAKEELTQIYSEFLLNASKSIDYHEYFDVDMQELQDEIDLREEDLMIAFHDFMEVVFERDLEMLYCEGIDSDLKSMLDEFLEMIACKYGYPVYRPMFFEDDDGEMDYVEYPYEDDIDEVF